MSGPWTWTYLDVEGAPAIPGNAQESASAGFPSQGDAETWLGTEWRDLAQAGVESVTLQRDGAVVYGPMSLRPAQ